MADFICNTCDGSYSDLDQIGRPTYFHACPPIVTIITLPQNQRSNTVAERPDKRDENARSRTDPTIKSEGQGRRPAPPQAGGVLSG